MQHQNVSIYINGHFVSASFQLIAIEHDPDGTMILDLASEDAKVAFEKSERELAAAANDPGVA